VTVVIRNFEVDITQAMRLLGQGAHFVFADIKAFPGTGYSGLSIP
jgi:hypothetical protein